MNCDIIKAISSDAEFLTDLTFKSKAYWNYSKKQLEHWKDELTISEDYIINNTVYKLTFNKVIVGYYSFIDERSDCIKLDNLFIHPNYIGKGLGKLLLEHCIVNAKEKNINLITLDSDPNAKQFYLNADFKVVGELKSSIKDRFLPIMELQIK
jgi:N-acetylglutamate synthase-like GNAT family acetyltransferase